MARRKKNSVKNIKPEKQNLSAQTNSKNIGIRWGESYTSLLLGIIVVLIGALFLVSLARNRHSKQITSVATNIITSTLIPLHTSPEATNSLVQPTKTPTATPAQTAAPKPTKVITAALSPSPLAQVIKPGQTIKQQIYTIKPGDDLWHIAEKFYNSGYNWIDIAKANNLDNPGMLFSGNQLIIPIVTPAIATVQLSPTQMPAPPQKLTPTPSINTEQAIKENTYTVQKGDDLWNIAVRAYGNGYKWADIAKANNLDNPGLIFSGNVLKIPR